MTSDSTDSEIHNSAWAVLWCAGWYYFWRHKGPTGNPSKAFPFGLRVRRLLPLMSHPVWHVLSPLRNRCRSIFTKQDCDKQTPMRPTMCLSSAGGLLKQSEAPLCVSPGRQWDHTGGASQDVDSLWARFPFGRREIHSLRWWAIHGVGCFLHPSSSVLSFVKHSCMHKARENQESFWTGT